VKKLGFEAHNYEWIRWGAFRGQIFGDCGGMKAANPFLLFTSKHTWNSPQLPLARCPLSRPYSSPQQKFSEHQIQSQDPRISTETTNSAVYQKITITKFGFTLKQNNRKSVNENLTSLQWQRSTARKQFHCVTQVWSNVKLVSM